MNAYIINIKSIIENGGFMDQKLEFVYSIHRKQSDYIGFHKHECYELVYYINGNGCTKVAGVDYKYSPSTFTIINPNNQHDENHVVGTDVIFIGFKSDLSSILKNGLYSDDHQHSVFNYLKQIKREIFEQKRSFSLKADLILGELLIELDRMFEQSGKKNKEFSYIQGFIEEHCNQQIDLNTLAQLSGYSYHHFRHLFKQKTGFSPINYIINKRLLNASYLLKTTNLNVLEISHECGFSNESQFAAMFKKYSGQTPSMYRKCLQP